MTNTDENQQAPPESPAEEPVSSEKREDIWALLIAGGILIVSVAFPDQVYHFFRNALYLF